MAEDRKVASRQTAWRRYGAILILIVLIAGAAALVFRHGAGGKGAAGEAPLIVGDQRGGVQALLKAAGELDNVPYRIDWALFPAASPLLEALGSSAIDVGGVGGAPFAFAYASGAKIKVIFAARQVSEQRGKTSAIIVPANSPLRTIGDIKGKRLATVRGSAGQDLALRLMERHGIGPRDVKWIYLNNSEAKAALASGSVDAWSTWGSYVGIALLEDHDRTLADATELPAQAGFYAASDTAIRTKRAQLQDFVERLARARVWAKGHREDFARVLSRETGIPLQVARLTVEDLITEPVPVDDGLKREQQAIFERYKRAGVIDTIPVLDGAFDSSFSLPSH